MKSACVGVLSITELKNARWNIAIRKHYVVHRMAALHEKEKRFDIKKIPFLDAIAKLRKSTISIVISVRPSAWTNSAPTERIFMKYDIAVFFEKMSRKFKFQ